MKRFLSLIPFAAFMTIALSSCKEEAVLPINTPAVNVTTEHLEPNADESGTVRAYVGTHVSAKGFNLDKVGAVKVDEIEAVIVEKTMTTLVFEIPDIAKPQQDDPYMVSLEVFDADATTTVFKYDYFVTVPVTDALVSGYSPTSGTVGTQINVSGRNLDKITRIDFGSEQVAQKEFISSSYEAIVV
ncbi:MAG: IPT/TIG domain-containing protein, partial [Candidatus Cryptobacteroides sp.]